MRGRRFVKQPVKRLLRHLGYDVVPIGAARRLPTEFSAEDEDLWNEVTPYTMTSPEAVYSLVGAVRYVVSSAVPGAIVECGVWRGGSMLAVARTLLSLERM